MKLETVGVEDAAGHAVAHGHRVEGGKIAKGTVLGAAEVEALRRAGLDEVVVARLDDGDVRENEAAAALAEAAVARPRGVARAGTGGSAHVRLRDPFTGRCNLLAEASGLAVVDAGVVTRANGIHESLTLATLPPFTPVAEGRLVGTAKVIPLAVPGQLLERAVAALGAGDGPALRVAPFRHARAALVLTELPGVPEKLHAKAEEVTRRRLEALGSKLPTVRRCAHAPAPLAELLGGLHSDGHDLLLVLGASAVVDRGDVVPRAVGGAGGEVDRLGIPVDPGNLLLLGRLHGVPVLGIPGCARSPRRNGFDQVLERVLAGVGTAPADLAAMAVGGLLAEIPSRPQPREDASAEGSTEAAPGGPGTQEPARDRGVAVLVLAAGHSSRMGDRNKLLATVDGEAIVARAVDSALEADVGPVIVVTGHDAEAVASALGDRPVDVARNPAPERGMSASLAAGLEAVAALPAPPAGVLVCLGDMPRVRPDTLRVLVAALDPDAGRSVCVPVHHRKRGNPVLWAGRFIPELSRIEGDVGGRALLGRYPEEVFEVEVDDPGVLLDVDTPEALEALKAYDAADG